MIMLSPTHRLMLMYNIDPMHNNAYYRYILGDFIPALQKLDLHMIYAWQVVSQHRPERQIDFVCEGEQTLLKALKNDRFIRAERRLKSFTLDYTRKVVVFANRCQV